MEEYLIGVCGIYCGACDHYLAHVEEGKHLLDRDSTIGQKVKEHPCGGCKTIDKDKLCKWCRGCYIRQCAQEKNHSHCGECEEFPCDSIREFVGDLPHKIEAYSNLLSMSELDMTKWLSFQKQRWSCSNCGAPYSFYELECNHCKQEVNGLYPDKR